MKTASLFSCSSWPFHFILFIVCLYTCFSTHFASSQCLDDQKSLLLHFKNNLTFSPYASDKLSGWNESIDCCRWSGVECDNSNGRVIGLDLSERYISGGINNMSSLFRLQFLQKLNLGFNDLEGEMPSSFGKLTSLTYLSLSDAGFTGQVPIEISQLVKLVVLDISQVKTWERGDARLYMKVPNLGEIIQNMTNMEELYLDGVDNSAMGRKWCEALSTSLPHLQVLRMRSCNLKGELHKSLLKLRNVSVILLGRNRDLVGPVPEFLAGFANLTKLSLKSCNLSGTVPRKLFQAPKLRSLDLSNNQNLRGTLPDFPRDGSLEELILANNNNLFGMLPSSISNLKRLRRLDLPNCRFHGKIPSSIESLNLLKYLDLSGNQFWQGPIPSFSSMQNLEYLCLSSCKNLSGSISGTDWGKLLKLKQLDLSYNSLDGSIPTSLLSLPSIYNIDLSENKFSGKLSEFASIASSKLTWLALSGNNLEGPVPKSIFQLRELEGLYLSSNRFNGTLHLDKLLLSLNNLRELDLSFNSLSVNTDGCGVNSSFPQLRYLSLASCNLYAMPDFLKNQSQFDYLDLSMNHMIGTVPGSLWRINELNLSQNHFVKLEPPVTHSNDSTLYLTDYIDLHSNNIQQKIPAFNSTMLDFSENKFYGRIPRALCNIRDLVLLNLGYNHLEGTIPDCLLSMPSLQVLNLRSNNLNSVIPDTFQKDCFRQTLDLNENFLEGRLPRSLAHSDQLEVLDVGYNQLNDTFPCHLKSLSKLQVIVLRSNKFHGMTICPGTHSMWPLLQILDLAFNHFSGELNARSLLKWKAMMAGKSQGKPKVGILKSESPYGNYYQNSMTLTFKGSTHELNYILTIFTSIDLSNNAFHGELPKELGNLNALIVLNLSHNSFSGQIPSSIGNLSQIESLDLSCNAFTGKIPAQLASLYNLEYLNLSDNKLSGKIPSSTQLDTFTASSYEGNQGLYGPPLSPPSRTKSSPGMSSPENLKWSLTRQLEWMLRGAEVGFPVGLTVFLGPILYIKRYREWYCKHLHRLVMKILRKEENSSGRKTRRSTQQRQRQ